MATAAKPKNTKEPIFHIRGERGAWQQLEPIPVRHILPHRQQALINHQEQLIGLDKRRGGLTPREALHVMYDVEWGSGELSMYIKSMTVNEANYELRELVKSLHNAARTAEMEAEMKEASKPCTHDRPRTLIHGARRCQKCGCMMDG